MSTANSSVPDPGKQSRKRSIPIITFRMGKDFFGFRINRVKEVVRYLPLTRIPKAPDYIPGIINLRGGVVTVVDLAMRFGLPPVANSDEAFIIVVEIAHEEITHLVGLRVDLVHEVIMLDPALLDASPHVGGVVASEYIEGIFLHNEAFVSLLNLDLAFDITELVNRAKLFAAQEAMG